MPVPATRTILPATVRNFGRNDDTAEIPPLTDIQTVSYLRFLQLDSAPQEREAAGLEGVLKEIFPIKSYDGTISLDYLKYELKNVYVTSYQTGGAAGSAPSDQFSLNFSSLSVEYRAQDPKGGLGAPVSATIQGGC